MVTKNMNVITYFDICLYFKCKHRNTSACMYCLEESEKVNPINRIYRSRYIPSVPIHNSMESSSFSTEIKRIIDYCPYYNKMIIILKILKNINIDYNI